MSETADELKALREEVAELRAVVEFIESQMPGLYGMNKGLWDRRRKGVPEPAYMPVMPLPMPPYPYQPNSSDASGVWRYPTSAGGTQV
jgi:hypothetical protein